MMPDELETLRTEVIDLREAGGQLQRELRAQIGLTNRKSSQLLMIGSELCGDPKISPDDTSDPRWTPTLRDAGTIMSQLRNEREACVCYLIDRGGQYDPSDAIVHALCKAAEDISDGTARDRFDAGEYDDIVKHRAGVARKITNTQKKIDSLSAELDNERERRVSAERIAFWTGWRCGTIGECGSPSCLCTARKEHRRRWPQDGKGEDGT